MEWLHDKMLFAFGRQHAPVVQVPGLPPGESIVLGTGILPNRKGHPLIQRWVGIRFDGESLLDKLDLPAVIDHTRFGRDPIPNPNSDQDLGPLRCLIGPAVAAMREELREARLEFDTTVRPVLDQQLERLAEFRTARTHQLEFRFERMAHVRDAEIRKVTNLYEEYKEWIRDTLETEDQPSIRIAAIFTGQGEA